VSRANASKANRANALALGAFKRLKRDSRNT
jgi:hypothetical protein